MKKERYAVVLILLAFFSGMVLTAATSGCDSRNQLTAQSDKAQAGDTAQSGDAITTTPQ